MSKFITTIKVLSIAHIAHPVGVLGKASLKVNELESNIGNTMSAVILNNATKI